MFPDYSQPLLMIVVGGWLAVDTGVTKSLGINPEYNFWGGDTDDDDKASTTGNGKEEDRSGGVSSNSAFFHPLIIIYC